MASSWTGQFRPVSRGTRRRSAGLRGLELQSSRQHPPGGVRLVDFQTPTASLRGRSLQAKVTLEDFFSSETR